MSDEEPQSLVAVLDELEKVVHAARAMPMSSSVLVARDEVLALVERARALLPGQLAHADEVLAGADKVLSDAHEHADRIIRSAHERADELVAQERVVLAAQARAAELVAEAEATAARLRHDADDYCDRRLADFEIDLGRVVAQVQAGRAKLAGRLEQPGPTSG
ncbi:MAG: ATPase [Actinomycetales bacterium]|nr:ATPase [Actinomycetales bacterium]